MLCITNCSLSCAYFGVYSFDSVFDIRIIWQGQKKFVIQKAALDLFQFILR